MSPDSFSLWFTVRGLGEAFILSQVPVPRDVLGGLGGVEGALGGVEGPLGMDGVEGLGGGGTRNGRDSDEPYPRDGLFRFDERLREPK